MDKIITLIVTLSGLIGTLGGLIIAYLTLRHQLNQDKPKIRIDAQERIIVTSGESSSEPLLVASIYNQGKVPITITSFYVKVGRRTGGLFVPKPLGSVILPFTLNPDTGCSLWVDYKEIQKNVRKSTKRKEIRIQVQIVDSADRSYFSNKHLLILHPGSWRKLKDWFSKLKKKVLSRMFP